MADLSEEEGGGIISNIQPITLIQFQTTLHKLVDFYTEKMIRSLNEPLIKDFSKATVLQDFKDTQCLKQIGCESSIKMATGCLKAEVIASTERSIEQGTNEQDQKENLKDLEYHKSKETFPDLFTQKKGETFRRVGVFNIKSKIGNGTFQYLYKNGLTNLLLENCGRPKRQYIDDQLENYVSAETNVVKGLRFKRRNRKKVKEKNQNDINF